MQATPIETGEDIKALEANERMTDQAVKILRTRRSAAYGQARAALPKATQAGWEEVLACEPNNLDSDEASATAARAGLLRLLERAVLPSHT